MILYRVVVIFCLLHVFSLYEADVVYREGMLLCRLQNQPHRGLGMLFYCHMKHPERVDYIRDYELQYLELTAKGWILEGQKRPVVPMYAVVQAKCFPWNKELQMIRKLVMFNHFKRMAEDAQAAKNAETP